MIEFNSNDPFGLFRQWMADAEKSESEDPNAMALATADGPSTAVSTRNSSARSLVATAARMVGSSSTTRIRFTPLTVGACCGPSG